MSLALLLRYGARDPGRHDVWYPLERADQGISTSVAGRAAAFNLAGEMSNWEAFTAVLRDPVFLVVLAFALVFAGFVFWESRRYKVEPVVILLAVFAVLGIVGCALVARMAVLTGYHR